MSVILFGVVSLVPICFSLLLMARKGPTSFEDLRTVNGITFATFNEAAKALGLLESDELFRRTLDEACDEISNLHRLQHYFAMLLFHSRYG